MKKSQIFMSIFIAVIMISSVIGFMYSPQQEDNPDAIAFNGVSFLPSQNNNWVAVINNNQLVFDYLPSELSGINSPLLYSLSQSKLYILYNPASKDQAYIMEKLYYNLNSLGKTAAPACLTEEDCPDIPIKSCKDNAILLKDSKNNQVYNEENCIVIEGDSLYQNQAADKIIQGLIGIKN